MTDITNATAATPRNASPATRQPAQRTVLASLSCAAVLCAASASHGSTYWNLLETTGGVNVAGNATSIANHNSGPIDCGLKPDWAFNNGSGLADLFLLSEDGGINGVYLFASVQYDIESSAGQGPMYLSATRTVEARVGTIESGIFTENTPDIQFLRNFLPNTAFSGSAEASFNFQAFQCCPTCPFTVDCDLIEVDLGDGFETVCGTITGECTTRWASGSESASAFFEWDPTGNGGFGSLTVDDPAFLSDTAIIMPAPSAAGLVAIGGFFAARRRRSRG